MLCGINTVHKKEFNKKQIPAGRNNQADIIKQNILKNSPTGIAEFDEIIGGGFPKGSVVLIAGSAGCGKTIFSFQWLFEGIKSNENGVYITFTEPLFKSLKNPEGMIFYDRNAVEQERLKVVDIRQYNGEKVDKETILNFIEKEIKKTNAKRLYT